jgi:hypothetical protein
VGVSISAGGLSTDSADLSASKDEGTLHVVGGSIVLCAVNGCNASSGGDNPVADDLCVAAGGVVGGESSGTHVLVMSDMDDGEGGRPDADGSDLLDWAHCGMSLAVGAMLVRPCLPPAATATNPADGSGLCGAGSASFASDVRTPNNLARMRVALILHQNHGGAHPWDIMSNSINKETANPFRLSPVQSDPVDQPKAAPLGPST